MTAQECLLHPWLSGDHSDRTEVIDQSRYLKIRDRIRAKYDAWDSFVLPIGRLSEYSSLRKLLIDKYKIHDAYFGKYQYLYWYFIYNFLRCVGFISGITAAFTSVYKQYSMYKIRVFTLK